MVFYLNGEGITYVERERQGFSGNTVCVVSSNEKHDEKYYSDSNVYIVKFNCETPLRSFLLNLPPKSAARVKEYLLRIKEESEKKEAFYQNVCSLLLGVIFYELKRCKNNNLQKSKIEIVENIKRYINEHYAQSLEFSEIADQYGYSFDRFRHIFVEVEGKTLNQYLLAVRIAKAKEMLEDNRLQIKEIASAVGFKTLSHFVNFFKSQMGVSPSVYRSVCANKTELGVEILQKQPTVILDTDLASDCDDAGAVALLNILHNNREEKIACISHPVPAKSGAACVDVVCRYFGNEVPIGNYRGKFQYDESAVSIYSKKAVETFGKGLDPDGYPDGLKLMRKTLSQSSGKVKLVGIGLLTRLSQLLASEADEYSPLNGRELIAEKVEEIVLMGGIFNHGGAYPTFDGVPYEFEYNLITDLPASRHFIQGCPVKITFVDFYMGNAVKTLGHIVSDAENDPVACCYKHFANGARESWDLVAVYYAVRGLGKCFTRSKAGEVTFDEAGHSVFTEKKGGLHTYLSYKITAEEMTQTLNELYDFGKEQVKNEKN